MANALYHSPGATTVLILGHSLHAPWNEGTRVIGRNMAQAASLLRAVRVVSVTHENFRGEQHGQLPVSHIYTRMSLGTARDYLTLPTMLPWVLRMLVAYRVGAVHLIGMPLAIAPILHRHGVRVVAHVVRSRPNYRSRIEHFRATTAGRMFDPWIDAYVCSSHHLRLQLIREVRPAHKVHVVVPPIDTEVFRPLDRAEARRKLGMNPHAFTMVYLGRLSHLRFPAEVLLREIGKVAHTRPGLTLTAFVPVRMQDDSVGEADGGMQRAMHSEDFPVEVRLQDLSEEQKVAAYSAADVVLLPFAAPAAVEPPLTLLEAMACQAVVAVSPAANSSDVVQTGVNGLTFRSPDELGTQLQHLIVAKPDYGTMLARRARATIIKDYSLRGVAQSLEHVWSAIGVPDSMPVLTRVVG